MILGEQKVLQIRLAQFLTSEVFNTVSEEDILRQTKEGWLRKGHLLTDGEVKLLKKEAKGFRESKFYEILKAELHYHARQGLNKAQSENDIISAKLLSYFVDMI